MPVDRPGRVLVTGAGGPSGISVMRSVESPSITTFAGDIDPYAAGLYLVAAEQRRILPRGDDPAFTDRVAELCEQDRIDVLVPTVDSELLPLARERDRFAAAGVTLVLASEETLAVCLDKWALDARCRGEVRTPQTWLVDETFDPLEPELPVIVKPRSGSGSRGIRLLGAREQLSALERDGTLLVQEHLPGPEYSLDVLADAQGEVLAVVPRARLKVDSGIAITGRTLHDPVLEQFGADVARLIGLTTVANVQAKEAADGRPALLEVNPRFPGTMPLTIAAGVDMPSLAVGEALGAPAPSGPTPLPFEDVAMVRTFTETFFGFEQIEAMQEQAAAGGAGARA